MLNTMQACCTSLNEKLTKLNAEAKSECTIYRVHQHLRNVNPNAYEPQVIAIGPYHHNKDHLKMMEDHKLRYFQHLINRKPSNNVESYAACVGKWEAEARKCYADAPTSLRRSEFIQMLVLDGCFILELLLKFDMQGENDPIFQMDWMIISVQRDLMLFENQLPFFVLCELFDLFEGTDQHSTSLTDILGRFFCDLYPWKGYKGQASVAPREVKHLLHFIHRNLLPQRTGTGEVSEVKNLLHFIHRNLLPRCTGTGTGTGEVSVAPREVKHLLHFIHPSCLPRCTGMGTGTEKKDKGLQFMKSKSATRLEEANVRFKISEPKAAFFDVRFENGVMIMSPLRVDDGTESFLRNLIAYEHYFGHDEGKFVTDYVSFLDDLVDSSKDVEILSRNEIVENWLSDEEAVAKMVNKLADSIVVPNTSYAEMIENVEKHCRKRRNRWMATLRRNYLSSPWHIFSLIVGAVLLLLTITQTVCSILQMV